MFFSSLFLVLFSWSSLAHTGESTDLTNSSVYAILATSVFVVAIIITCFFCSPTNERVKKFLFLLIIIPIIVTTIFIVSATMYHNSSSYTKGPVHWHADFEVWKCGQKVDLRDPSGVSNRIGTPLLHEHNDNRIHVEGTVSHVSDISLQNLFEVVGGNILSDSIVVQTNDGIVSATNGEFCGKEKGILQVFVEKIQNPTVNGQFISIQEKVNDFPSYILSPFSSVPPGDCIIIDFDQAKDHTDHLCESYKIAKEEGVIHGG